MDHHTKMLLQKGTLHTQAVVTADPHFLTNSVTFTVYPPTLSMEVSQQILDHEDKQLVAAQLAEYMGKEVAHVVKEQVLKAYEMSAGEAVKHIHETFVQKMSGDHPLFVPTKYEPSPFWSFNGSHLTFAASPQPALEISAKEAGDWVSWLDKTLKAAWDPQHVAIPEEQVKIYKDMILGDHITAGMFPENLEKEIQDWSGPPQADSSIVNVLAQSIPGFLEMKQPCPVGEDTCYSTGYCDPTSQLYRTIVHLNDQHKWTREQIADWLETLDHDLTFKSPEEEVNEDGQ